MIQLYDSGGLCGYDYEGCPVWYDLTGALDPKGLLLSASKQDLIRKRIKACELLLKECDLQSQKVSDWDRGLCPYSFLALSTPGSAGTWLCWDMVTGFSSYPSTNI